MSLIKKSKGKIKKHHLHFAHGWCWGVAFLAVLLLMVTGFRDGYFYYWFGSDYDIVNVHEVVQTSRESEVLYDAMRNVHIKTTVLVGSPWEVIYFDGSPGFSDYEENNREVLDVYESNSNRFAAFCTLDPSDPDYMETVETCVLKGAMGFKLYSGHSFFYDKPLDDPSIFPFYEYVQANGLVLMFHVNTGNYQDEFETVLSLYPDMKTICPHFCLSSKDLLRLSALFDRYPNLHTDISFGSELYLEEGLTALSSDPELYRDFITKYADRFFYGTDAVVTAYDHKDAEWLTARFQVYRDALEKGTYTYEFEDGSEGSFNGLNLDHDVLEQIYESNWARLTAN